VGTFTVTINGQSKNLVDLAEEGVGTIQPRSVELRYKQLYTGASVDEHPVKSANPSPAQTFRGRSSRYAYPQKKSE
jgi:hypothetical protein